MFQKYQHIERFGTDETENMEKGLCYVFPKIDGTNGSVWMNRNAFGDFVLNCGSRNRELEVDNDNQGFNNYIESEPEYYKILLQNKNYRLFGEWLIPHSLKTYRDDAWRKFYIFDVMDGERYLSYDEYQPILEQYKLDYIPCIAKIENGTYEQFVNQLDKTNFLIKDGEGVGEGIVIKRYDYVNKYGRTTWAKIVRSEFKEVHQKTMGASEIKGKKQIESEAIKEYLTETLIEKTYQKIKNENDGWSSKYIPQLLGRVCHDFVIEEIWTIVKKYKYPVLNFKELQYWCNSKVKEVKKDLF